MHHTKPVCGAGDLPHNACLHEKVGLHSHLGPRFAQTSPDLGRRTVVHAVFGRACAGAGQFARCLGPVVAGLVPGPVVSGVDHRALRAFK